MKSTYNGENQQVYKLGYATVCELLKKNSGEESLMISRETLNQMLDEYEDMLDIIAFENSKKRKQEYFPKEVVDRLINKENPLRVYREYRALTQQKLADAAGVSRDMIAMIETGKKKGSVATIKKLAQALNLDIEDLV